ncbi:hypothetical protein Hanom_Chr10g00918371 [Helianthus anomalus]
MGPHIIIKTIKIYNLFDYLEREREREEREKEERERDQGPSPLAVGSRFCRAEPRGRCEGPAPGLSRPPYPLVLL